MPDGPLMFGRYTFQKQLGQGGMGIVVLATDTVLGRPVAIKVIRPEQKDLTESRARFFREARLAAQLIHPNSALIFDLGEREDGTLFLVMEYVDGKALAAFCGTPEPPVAQKLRWLVDVARGLAAGHKRGLIHRDLKPQNVMISSDGIAKVVDYGLAKRLETSPEMRQTYRTEMGFVVGTPAYMAPEQLEGQDIDARVDQFAWGLTAHALLVGRNPRAADPLLGSKVPSLAGVPGVGDAAAHVIARALEHQRDARYPTMDDVAARLEESLRPTQTHAPAPPVVVKNPIPQVVAAVAAPFPGDFVFERRPNGCFVTPVELAAFSPDGERVVAFGRGKCAFYTDSFWREAQLPSIVQPEGVRCVAVLNDGRLVVGGVNGLAMKIKSSTDAVRWSDKSGGPPRTFMALDATPEGWVTFLGPSDTGSVVATVGARGLSCVELGARLRAVATAATGELVACGERGKLLYLTQKRELVMDRLGEHTLSAIARGRDRLYVVGYDGVTGTIDPTRGHVTCDPPCKLSFEHVAVFEDDVWAADDGGGLHLRTSRGEWILKSPMFPDTPKVKALWAGRDAVRALMHDGTLLTGRRR